MYFFFFFYHVKRGKENPLVYVIMLETNHSLDQEEYLHQSPAASILLPEDYPKRFRGCAHPEDYRIENEPIQPNLFLYKPLNNSADEYSSNLLVTALNEAPILCANSNLHQYKPDTHIRLFLRMSIKISENQFTAATFLLDTACCPHFNVSPVLKTLIRSRIKKSDIGADYLVTIIKEENAECIVKEGPANVMGLPMFFLLGLSFQPNPVYDEEDIAYNIGTMTDIPYI